MQLKCQVFKEVYTPAGVGRDKQSGQQYKKDEVWELLLLDMSEPAEDSLADLFHYRLTEEEKAKWWGKALRKCLVVGVHRIYNGQSAPFMRGRIIGEANGKGA